MRARWVRELVGVNAIVCTLLAAPGARAAGTPPEVGPGFHDLEWGDAPAGDMTLAEGRRDGESTWVREGEALGIGDVKAEAIRYFFWKGRLVSVGVRGGAGFKELLAALQTRWGSPVRSGGKVETYTWMSEGENGRTIAGLELEGLAGFRLAVFSEELTDAMEVEQAMRPAAR